jgi:hypothetical protein
MLSVAHRAPKCSRIYLVVAGLAVAAVVGGCGTKSDQERFDDAAKEIPGFHKETLGKFAGKVLVDGQAPKDERGKRLFVVLIPADHLDQATDKKAQPIHTSVGRNGNFEFMTYLTGDGVPVGKYVVTFAQFGKIATGRGGMQPGANTAGSMYGGADDLKGLYSDPDKNAKDDKFVVDIAAPGRSDYEFNLELAGREPEQRGPHAIRTIRGY